MKVGLSLRSLPIILAQFSCFLGVGAILPVLPLHLVKDLHASGWLLGLVLGVYPFAALVGRFVGGWAADLHGRVFALSVGLLGASVMGFLLILPLTAGELFSVRLFQGFFQGGLSVAAVTWMMDISNPNERAHSLAMIGAGVWGGTTVGVLIGGILNSLPSTGALAGVAALIGIPALRWAQRPPGLSKEKVKRSFMPKAAFIPGITFGLGAVGYSAIVGFIVLHLNSREASGIVALSAFTTTVLLGRFVAVPVATHFGLQRSLKPVLLISACGLILISTAHITMVAVAGVVLVGLAHSILWPALGSLVAGRVRAEERGAAMGFMTAFYDIAVGLSSILFGTMATKNGTARVFLVASGFVIFAAVFDGFFSKGRHLVNTKRAAGDIGDAPVL